MSNSVPLIKLICEANNVDMLKTSKIYPHFNSKIRHLENSVENLKSYKKLQTGY